MKRIVIVIILCTFFLVSCGQKNDNSLTDVKWVGCNVRYGGVCNFEFFDSGILLITELAINNSYSDSYTWQMLDDTRVNVTNMYNETRTTEIKWLSSDDLIDEYSFQRFLTLSNTTHDSVFPKYKEKAGFLLEVDTSGWGGGTKYLVMNLD